MTIKEYREQNPNCSYCRHRINGLDTCAATEQKMSKRTAKKCPCYEPDKWYLDAKDDIINELTKCGVPYEFAVTVKKYIENNTKKVN